MRAGAEARATEADFRANHDPLTGLGNRAKFDASLGELTTRPTDHEPRPGSAALLLLDLNGFKQVNDQFGHPTGDEVLQIIARRLQSHSRHQDQLCRIGGDEFAILAKKSAAASTDTPISAEAIAAKIIGTIGTPILIEGRTIEVGVAIGIAYFPDTAKTGRDLMAKADLALYAAKENNRMSARSSYVVSS
ncbi:GGDEF domain-containing protein [Microvirga antarctica]|uniref:GGDEF domain-containing protein n=1 Tax=Microvirga antarctica TaxID=2819233 RepID=UPI001B3078AC|nr:GGDEF domain-containing protein [Microvirga antarctica]